MNSIPQVAMYNFSEDKNKGDFLFRESNSKSAPFLTKLIFSCPRYEKPEILNYNFQGRRQIMTARGVYLWKDLKIAQLCLECVLRHSLFFLTGPLQGSLLFPKTDFFL